MIGRWSFWYRCGAWLFIMLGALHNITSFIMIRFSTLTEDQQNIIAIMKAHIPPIPTNHSLWEFHIGFSYVMGWLLMVVGAYALMGLDGCKKKTPIILLNIGSSVLMFIYSINYFFIVPAVFSGGALLAFLMAHHQMKRE